VAWGGGVHVGGEGGGLSVGCGQAQG
jgi:hypothetical protein